MDFYSAIANRRSVYETTKECPVTEEKIEEIIRDVVAVAPSSFNSQSSRVVLLFGRRHEEFWKIVLKKIREVAAKEAFAEAEKKIRKLKNSCGTILFYEEQQVVSNLQEDFPIYRDSFPMWAEHSSAMLQYAIWTALEIEGVGASLQHYNPLIDAEMAQKFNIPGSWRLIAQMPFGGIAEKPAEEKQLSAVEKIIVK